MNMLTKPLAPFAVERLYGRHSEQTESSVCYKMGRRFGVAYSSETRSAQAILRDVT
jgi:hypothetical protein